MDRVKHKYLGKRGLVALIALLSAFVPLSTDLYLPALPGMSAYFGVGADRINWTLTAFFIFFALGTLIWGPLSDRYGRKPIMILGLVIYVLSSAACAFMWSVDGLILCRIFQAIGGSASGAVATAIVKDVYSGQKRKSVLAIVQSMTLIAPAVAPVLGAFLLKIVNWQGVFWVLAGIGVTGLLISLFYKETIGQRTSGMLLSNFGRLGVVLKNRGFTILLLLFSLSSIATFAYIGSSAYIYQNGFHLSEQMYSFYFSFNAIGMIFSPMIYLRLAKRFHDEKIIPVCFALIAASGLLVCFLGNLQPWVFALCFLPATAAASCVRAPSSNLMLEQQKGDNGSVSSLMGCAGLLVGSLGMQLIGQPWDNLVLVLGIIASSAGLICLAAWPFVIKQVVRVEGPSLTTSDA